MFREVQVGQVFFGNACHVERNRLVAEVAVMCKKAGIEENPLDTPEVMDDVVRRLRLTEPCFYFAGDLKRVNDYERNKIRFTRLAGAIVYPGGTYAVYKYRKEIFLLGGQAGGVLSMLESKTGMDQLRIYAVGPFFARIFDVPNGIAGVSFL